MKKKTLFQSDNSEMYNNDAVDINKSTQELVLPVIRKYQKQGYTVREIVSVIQEAIYDMKYGLLFEKDNDETMEELLSKRDDNLGVIAE